MLKGWKESQKFRLGAVIFLVASVISSLAAWFDDDGSILMWIAAGLQGLAAAMYLVKARELAATEASAKPD